MSKILTKLSDIKSSTKKNIKNDTKKLITIKSIKRILEEIDFNSEEVLINNFEKLFALLTSLKGSNLSKREVQLVKEIVDSKPKENYSNRSKLT